METITINYTLGKSIAAEHYKPKGTPNGGAVIVAYGSDGMKEPWATMIREYAAELSQRNYNVLIPDYLPSAATTPREQVFAQIPGKLPLWQTAIDATINFAATPRVALLGFSLGGHLCLRLRHRAKVLVEFFAPELIGIGAAATPVPRAQIHHGEADELVVYANAIRIEKQLKAEGTLVELCSYPGAVHGFPASDPNSLAASHTAKSRTLAFIAKHL